MEKLTSKNGMWTHFSILKRDNRIRDRCSTEETSSSSGERLLPLASSSLEEPDRCEPDKLEKLKKREEIIVLETHRNNLRENRHASTTRILWIKLSEMNNENVCSRNSYQIKVIRSPQYTATWILYTLNST